MTNPFHFYALVFVSSIAIGLSACGETTDSASPISATSSSTSDERSSEQDNDAGDSNDNDGDNDGDDHDDDRNDDDDKASGLSSHEHGVAELSVAWSDDNMVIDLISPTNNIFGFENEAATDEELAVVKDRTEALLAPGVITVNVEAGCELSGEATTELDVDGSHSEITASWLFVCENPDEIKQLDAAALFGQFPGIEDLDVQWASPTRQSAVELTPSSTVASFE